jgi:dUTP pyrophosphatase
MSNSIAGENAITQADRERGRARVRDGSDLAGEASSGSGRTYPGTRDARGADAGLSAIHGLPIIVQSYPVTIATPTARGYRPKRGTPVAGAPRAEPVTIHHTSELHYPRHVTEAIEVLISSGQVPQYAHPGDAGADLYAAEAVELKPGQRATVGTGVSIALPEGYVAFVVPRSGLAAKHGITIVNSPGTVDAGYRGEIRVTLLNTDLVEAYPVAVGDRIAQIIVQPVTQARFVQVDTLPDSSRGAGGFGSTGYNEPHPDRPNPKQAGVQA